jgi:hypothetical protein
MELTRIVKTKESNSKKNYFARTASNAGYFLSKELFTDSKVDILKPYYALAGVEMVGVRNPEFGKVTGATEFLMNENGLPVQQPRNTIFTVYATIDEARIALQEEEETKQEATLARATATINTQAKIFALAQGKNLDAAKVQELANAF